MVDATRDMKSIDEDVDSILLYTLDLALGSKEINHINHI